MNGSWRYRVIRDKNGWHRIAEVHKLDNGEVVWTADPINPGSDTLNGLRDDLTRMLQATTKPALEETELYALVGKEEEGHE